MEGTPDPNGFLIQAKEHENIISEGHAVEVLQFGSPELKIMKCEKELAQIIPKCPPSLSASKLVVSDVSSQRSQ